MIDNGLIEKYFLNRKTSSSHCAYIPTNSIVSSSKITLPEMQETNFYTKPCPPSQVDAEVLLSQVYAKAGLKSAIYMPAILQSEQGSKCGVISNDVIDTPSQRAFIKEFFERHGYIPSNAYDIRDAVRFDPRIILPYKKDYKIDTHNDKFSKNCIRQMIKTRLFDVASFNVDRHFRNFYYEMKDNKPDDVVLFDYAMSGNVYRYVNTNHRYYPNDFAMVHELNLIKDFVTKKTREDMIENFKNNETMHDYIETRELVDALKSVDIKETARDIKDTIGYEVDSFYTKEIAESFENLAEEIQP